MNKMLSLALACALTACATSEPPPPSPPPQLPPPDSNGEYSLVWPDLGRGEDRYITIDIGPDSFEHCRNVSPKFPFDSAQTRAQDAAAIAALASCLNHDSMRDRNVLLVGRTDAQGTAAYNAQLGKRRADRIKDLLIRHGLAPERIKTNSKGEVGAVGDEPDYSRGYDRRVDIVVLGGKHAP